VKSVLAAPVLLKSFSPEMKEKVLEQLDNEDFMLPKIAEHRDSYYSVSKRLKGDFSFNLKGGLANPAVVRYFSSDLRRKLLEHIEAGKCGSEDQSAVLVLKNTLINDIRSTPTQEEAARPDSPAKSRRIRFDGEASSVDASKKSFKKEDDNG
jgi:hypothetical protein